MPDPKLIASKHNGKFTRGGVTVEVCMAAIRPLALAPQTKEQRV
jgi:hypothetical protein